MCENIPLTVKFGNPLYKVPKINSFEVKNLDPIVYTWLNSTETASSITLNPIWHRNELWVRRFIHYFLHAAIIVVTKPIFLMVCVILSMGGRVCLSTCWDTNYPPPHLARAPCKHFGNELTVKILLRAKYTECLWHYHNPSITNFYTNDSIFTLFFFEFSFAKIILHLAKFFKYCKQC